MRKGNIEKGDEAQEWQGEKGWEGNRNGEKGYNKGIIIFLVTRTMPDIPASKNYTRSSDSKKTWNPGLPSIQGVILKFWLCYSVVLYV